MIEKKENPTYRKFLLDLRKDQAGRFDTLLTTLASGALGATFFYGKDLFPVLNEFAFFVWALACLSFSCSLWIVLRSFLVPINQISKLLEMKEIKQSVVVEELKKSNKKIKRSRKNGVTLLFLGVFLLFCFSLLNFYSMTDGNKQSIPIPDKQDLACEIPTPAEVSGEQSQGGGETAPK